VPDIAPAKHLITGPENPALGEGEGETPRHEDDGAHPVPITIAHKRAVRRDDRLLVMIDDHRRGQSGARDVRAVLLFGLEIIAVEVLPREHRRER
jgi:hypothetical protein